MQTIPRAWEEALSFYNIRNKNLPGNITSEKISKTCFERLKAFNEGMLRYNNNKEQAKNTLKSNFENTFWYYLVYLNPKVTNANKQ